MSTTPVVIIGAGLAGLCCARTLIAQGVDVLLLEAHNEVGGRVRTDVVDGFQLDRGFQVLQTAYPEAQRQLDYTALRLRHFEPGAIIRTAGKSIPMCDPWRRPLNVVSTLFNEVGLVSDRWKLAKLRWHVTNTSIDQLWSEPDTTTMEYLQSSCGFSTDFIQRFLQPWFSGVFFEKELATSSRFFKFIFRMFAEGNASLPAGGIGTMSKQLAESIPADRVRLSSKVSSIEGLSVRVDGTPIDSRAVVVAVEGPEASRLTGGMIKAPQSLSTTCFYFAASKPPITDSLLVLNGDPSGPINNMCVPSNIAPTYAPEGQALISVSVVGPHADESTELELNVRRQLREWYGSQVDRWLTLPRYHIRHALPGQPAHYRDNPASSRKLADGLYHCGDYCESASFHGAMLSGRRAAEAVLADLRTTKP